jgi:DNA-binding transcriptional LysR family regulator
MELMQLEMFVAVVEERSVRKAAERVFRTPPAISMALKKLESEMGTQLLDRSCRMNYKPTLAGRRLYDYATQMVALRNKALLLNGSDRFPSNRVVQLSVGLGPSSSSVSFPHRSRLWTS